MVAVLMIGLALANIFFWGLLAIVAIDAMAKGPNEEIRRRNSR